MRHRSDDHTHVPSIVELADLAEAAFALDGDGKPTGIFSAAEVRDLNPKQRAAFLILAVSFALALLEKIVAGEDVRDEGIVQRCQAVIDAFMGAAGMSHLAHLNSVKERLFMCLTGSGGTGKSAVIKVFVQWVTTTFGEASAARILMCGSTGKAAILLSAILLSARTGGARHVCASQQRPADEGEGGRRGGAREGRDHADHRRD